MNQRLLYVSLLVRDYDEALAFFTATLDFTLREDTYVREQDKRWVVIDPPGSCEAGIVLARPSTPAQETLVGKQCGGRVCFFLGTDDFARDYEKMRSRGVTFVRAPRYEPYGTVAVFEDLYGNGWDLLQANKQTP
ncbi:MAG: VOC family protein [Pseudomonadota bacterium]